MPEAIKVAEENNNYCSFSASSTSQFKFFWSFEKALVHCMSYIYIRKSCHQVYMFLTFNEAWLQSIQPEIIKSGFRKAGIYPFDPTKL